MARDCKIIYVLFNYHTCTALHPLNSQELFNSFSPNDSVIGAEGSVCSGSNVSLYLIRGSGLFCLLLVFQYCICICTESVDLIWV